MKDIYWRSSLDALNQIFAEKNIFQKSLQAQEHFRCLVECINTLYDEKKKLKEDLEEFTIKTCSNKQRYVTIKTRLERTDLEDAVAAAKKSAEEKKAKITENFEHNLRSIVNLEMKTSSFIASNKDLIESKTSNSLLAKQLTTLMGDLIEQKSLRRIDIIGKRSLIFDTNENTAIIYDRSMDRGKESFIFLLKSRREFKAALDEIEKWNRKLMYQDNEATKYKKEVRSLTLKLIDGANYLALREIELKNMKKNLAELQENTAELKLELAEKENEKKKIIEAIQSHSETFKTVQKQMEIKIRNVIQNIKNCLREIAEAQETTPLLLLSKESLKADKIGLTEDAKFVKRKVSRKRNEVKMTSNVVMEALSVVGQSREETNMLKENIFLIIYLRDIMEKKYSKRFQLLRTDLLSEMDLRQKIEKECKKLDDFLAKLKKIGLSSDDDSDEDLEVRAARLTKRIMEMKQKRITQKRDIVKKQIDVERTKSKTFIELAAEEEKLTHLAEDTVELSELRDLHLEILNEINEEFEDKSQLLEDIVNKHKNLLEKKGPISDDIKCTKTQIQELKTERENLQQQISEVGRNIDKFIVQRKKEAKDTAPDILKLIAKLETIQIENEKIAEASRKWKNMSNHELLELQQMKDTICKKTKSFDELNKKYRRLENVESLLSLKASCEVDATINEIKSHKTASQGRLKRAAETIGELDVLIGSCIKLGEPFYNVCSKSTTTHLSRRRKSSRRTCL